MKNGVGHVPAAASPPGVDLSYEIRELRRRFLTGTLTDDVAHALERLPGWAWRPGLVRTRRFLTLLRRHTEKNGWEAMDNATIVEGERVGRWLGETRHKHNRGRGVSRWLARELESIPGFSWAQSRALAEARRMARLAENHLQTLRLAGRMTHGRLTGQGVYRGTARVEASVFFFRRHRNDKRIPRPVIQALEALPGWTWDPFEDIRTKHLKLLRRLAAQHGALPEINSKTVIQGIHLGSWIASCWQRYRIGRLSRELVRELEAIPGWTWGETIDDRHRRKLDALYRFLEKHDLSEVHLARNFDGVNLRDWVTGQRVHYREGRKQSEWLIRELEKIPGWSWSPRTERARSKSRRRYRHLDREA